MSIPTLSFEELHARYQLLCRCTRVEPQATSELEQQIQSHLQRLEELLSNDLRALARQGSPDDFVDIYFALQQALEHFRELCFFPGLANKRLVAFGGGFSAGKSSLINTLLGEHLLVAEIDPTTSLPTYVMRGDANNIQARNLFDQWIDLSLGEFRSLTHDEIDKYGSNVSRLLHSIFISRINFPWENLVLIDTPGHTKYEDAIPNTHKDQELSRRQLNAADAIVWVIDGRKGCITEDDLQFLLSLNRESSKIIVVSRADQKTTEDMHGILLNIRRTLKEKDISFVDVISTSKNTNSIVDIKKFLEEINKTPKEYSFGEKLSINFDKYANFLQEKEFRIDIKTNDLEMMLVFPELEELENYAKKKYKKLEQLLPKVREKNKIFKKIEEKFIEDVEIIGKLKNIRINSFGSGHSGFRDASNSLKNTCELINHYFKK